MKNIKWEINLNFLVILTTSFLVPSGQNVPQGQEETIGISTVLIFQIAKVNSLSQNLQISFIFRKLEFHWAMTDVICA